MVNRNLIAQLEDELSGDAGRDFSRLVESGVSAASAFSAVTVRYTAPFDRFNERYEEQLRTGYGEMPKVIDTLIIGGGLNTAVFAAVMEARSGSRPWVLTTGAGGTFRRPRQTFYINSSNRPGEDGLPGEYDKSLNYLPYCEGQLAGTSGRKYPTDATFGLVIKTNLALYANVLEGEVGSIAPNAMTGETTVSYRSGGSRVAVARRVVIATGVGTPRDIPLESSTDERVYNFDEFMDRVNDERFLEGIGRVAVIGGGNCADVVVEQLMGLGPASRAVGPMEVQMVERVDWFGQACATKQAWRRNARPRYQGIGSLMPDENRTLGFPYDDESRIGATVEKVDRIVRERKNGRYRLLYGTGSISPEYDMVVVCVGYENTVNDLFVDAYEPVRSGRETVYVPLMEDLVMDTSGAVARKIRGHEIYKVGPCADIPVTPQELDEVPALTTLPVNSAAAWRYVRRTARLGEMLTERGEDLSRALRTVPVGPVNTDPPPARVDGSAKDAASVPLFTVSTNATTAVGVETSTATNTFVDFTAVRDNGLPRVGDVYRVGDTYFRLEGPPNAAGDFPGKVSVISAESDFRPMVNDPVYAQTIAAGERVVRGPVAGDVYEAFGVWYWVTDATPKRYANGEAYFNGEYSSEGPDGPFNAKSQILESTIAGGTLVSRPVKEPAF